MNEEEGSGPGMRMLVHAAVIYHVRRGRWSLPRMLLWLYMVFVLLEWARPIFVWTMREHHVRWVYGDRADWGRPSHLRFASALGHAVSDLWRTPWRMVMAINPFIYGLPLL